MAEDSPNTRVDGNPNQRALDREGSRLGRERTPEDIPKQDVTKKGSIAPGNVDPSSFQPSTDETQGQYRLGAPARPNIVHDLGHLRLGRRSPGAGDYAALARWRAMLVGAEALRPDLTDAVAAYRHFLDGEGKARVFSYERYIMNDASGQATLRNAILDFQYAAIEAWIGNDKPRTFRLSGPAIPCGTNAADLPYLGAFFPYPRTENWQKTIGAHTIWLSGDVAVIESLHIVQPPKFRATMTLHAEDRYNFNVNDVDVATGIPDSDNGRLEQTGLGHQYDHFSSVTRLLEWQGFDLGVGLSAKPNTTRLRQPNNNRRLRNRL